MNKRTRLIVSLLFVVMIILAAAITQFYVSVPKDKPEKSSQDEIVKIISTDRDGYSIFSDGKGGFGIAEAGRIVAAPEWRSLEYAENDRYIAEKKINGQMKKGCVDYEGNVVVPLIYKDIQRLTAGGVTLYSALSEDDSCVIYDESFAPAFFRPWRSCVTSNGEFIFTDDSGEFIYSVSSDGLLFNRASLSGTIAGLPYSLSLYSRVQLSKLTPFMIERMAEDAGKYVEYAFSGDNESIADMGGKKAGRFRLLFSDSAEITSKKPVSISDMHIYSMRSEDGTPCYEVSVMVETELIYTDETGAKKDMRTSCKAAVQFSGSSDSTLKALSGRFEPEKPDYPTEEPTTLSSEFGVQSSETGEIDN